MGVAIVHPVLQTTCAPPPHKGVPMFFLAIPAFSALVEIIVTATVGTIAAKAASDMYDHVTGASDAHNNSTH